MNEAPLTILCITGWCRSGSTIIGNILNEIPGFFHVGELHFLWKNSAGRGANQRCGCGRPLTECPVWSEIIALGRPDGLSAQQHADEVIRRQLACVRTRHTWRVLRRGLYRDEIRAHAALMSLTYRAAARRMGARVIVDTTKIPGEAALLPYLDGITTYFVHLVRDPRAIAESWRLPKDYAYAMSSAKSTAYWYGFNLASHAITRRFPQRSMFLRYEDFIADPEQTIGALLQLCDTDPAVNPMRGRMVDLHTNHTVTGNPDRFLTGPTAVRERDDSWQTNLSGPARLAAVALSWPLYSRYGYRYRGTFRPDSPPLDAATSGPTPGPGPGPMSGPTPKPGPGPGRD